MIQWLSRLLRDGRVRPMCMNHPAVYEQVGEYSRQPEFICKRCKRRVPAGEIHLFDIPVVRKEWK